MEFCVVPTHYWEGPTGSCNSRYPMGPSPDIQGALKPEVSLPVQPDLTLYVCAPSFWFRRFFL